MTPHHRLAVLAARRGEFEQANQHFQAALRSASKDVELLSDAGYCFYLQNRVPEAEQLYQKALTLEPNNQAVCNNVAMLLADKGRYDESLAMFQRVNSEAQAHTNLAFMLTQAGQYEQAEAHFNRALTLDSTLRPAAKGLLQLADRQKHAKLAALPSKGAPRSSSPTAGDPAGQTPANGDVRAQFMPTAGEPARQIRLTSQEVIATNTTLTDGAGPMNQGAQSAVFASPDRSPAPQPNRFANGVSLSAREDVAAPVAPQAVPAPRWLPAENVSRPRNATPAAQGLPTRKVEADGRNANTPGNAENTPRGSRYAAGPNASVPPPAMASSSPRSELQSAGRQTINSRFSDPGEIAASALPDSIPPTRGAASRSPWPPPPDLNLGPMNPNSWAPTGPSATPAVAAPLGFDNAPASSGIMPAPQARPATTNLWGGAMAPVKR